MVILETDMLTFKSPSMCKHEKHIILTEFYVNGPQHIATGMVNLCNLPSTGLTLERVSDS